jgi:tRNA modification GTPase
MAGWTWPKPRVCQLLLFAETEAQRVAAMRMANGHLSRQQVEGWRQDVLRF